MLTKEEKEVIEKSAKKYKVSTIILFGSSLNQHGSKDIDLAVKGIAPSLFFDFYGELFKNLSKTVDLVDMEEVDDYFAKRILEGGKIIYGT
jgi:predicted nucleotidyltransferase